MGDAAGGLTLQAPLAADDAVVGVPQAPQRGRWHFWRSPPDQPAWARPLLLARGRAGRPVLRVGHQRRHARDVLRRRRAEHVAELAQLLLRRVRPLGDGHGRQAARCLLGPGAVGPGVRLPRVVGRAPPGRRGHPDGAGALPRRAPRGRRRCRAGRGRRPGRHARHHPAQPGQHLGLVADPAARARGRRRHGRLHDGTPGAPAGGRRLGRAGLPGQDAPGLARPARALPRLPAGGADTRPRPPRRRTWRSPRSVALGVSLSWMLVVTLVPAHDRPYVGRQLQQLRLQPGLPLQRHRPDHAAPRSTSRGAARRPLR